MDKIETIVDVITGEVTHITTPFTEEELAYARAVDEEKAQTDQTASSIKQSAISKLTALGLTADEVKALLGVSA